MDDFALRALDATQTNDFYEIVVERHRRAATIWMSNREPAEWLGLTTDALLAQSAIDRLTSGAHTTSSKAPPTANAGASPLTPETRSAMLDNTSKWSHARGGQHGGPITLASDTCQNRWGPKRLARSSDLRSQRSEVASRAEVHPNATLPTPCRSVALESVRTLEPHP